MTLIFSALLRSKGVLMRYPGARPRERRRALASARDKNVQFLRLDQFLSNYKG